MSLRVACLHTAQSNADLFASQAPDGVTMTHLVRPDLLANAEAAGGLTAEIRAETAALLHDLAQDADAVLLTCSTIGPAAADAGALRVDTALARQAVAQAGNGWVIVLCAAPTTVEPTRALFEAAAEGTGARIATRVIPCAWDAFKSGNARAYHGIIAQAADAAYAEGATTIALAQASMAPAAALCRLGRPLTSPEAALAAIARS